MAKVSWSAFECSSLAAFINDAKEQERLFALGYQQGKLFINAVRMNQIEEKDKTNLVPLGFLMNLQGPTPDFILGRIFESAQKNALEDVIVPAAATPKDFQVTIARGKFSKQNCGVLRSVQ